MLHGLPRGGPVSSVRWKLVGCPVMMSPAARPAAGGGAKTPLADVTTLARTPACRRPRPRDAVTGHARRGGRLSVARAQAAVSSQCST